MKDQNAIRVYSGRKFEKNEITATEDALVEEIKLSVEINGKPFTTTMCTPGMEKELVFGLLYAEDIFRGKVELVECELDRSGDANSTVRLSIPEDQLGQGYLSSRSLLSVSSCGICGKTELDYIAESALVDESRFPASIIHVLFGAMRSRQHNYSISGGSHAAGIFTASGDLIAFAEDIGRHNAIDKAVGELIISSELGNASALLVSSRISYEIVAKCFTAGIPVLAAVSAPSTLAVDFAKELGISLIGFCRNDRFTIYSHPQRLTLNSVEELS